MATELENTLWSVSIIIVIVSYVGIYHLYKNRAMYSHLSFPNILDIYIIVHVFGICSCIIIGMEPAASFIGLNEDEATVILILGTDYSHQHFMKFVSKVKSNP